MTQSHNDKTYIDTEQLLRKLDQLEKMARRYLNHEYGVNSARAGAFRILEELREWAFYNKEDLDLDLDREPEPKRYRLRMDLPPLLEGDPRFYLNRRRNTDDFFLADAADTVTCQTLFTEEEMSEFDTTGFIKEEATDEEE